MTAEWSAQIEHRVVRPPGFYLQHYKWDVLGQFQLYADVAIDNKHIENLMLPWVKGRKG